MCLPLLDEVSEYCYIPSWYWVLSFLLWWWLAKMHAISLSCMLIIFSNPGNYQRCSFEGPTMFTPCYFCLQLIMSLSRRLWVLLTILSPSFHGTIESNPLLSAILNQVILITPSHKWPIDETKLLSFELIITPSLHTWPLDETNLFSFEWVNLKMWLQCSKLFSWFDIHLHTML